MKKPAASTRRTNPFHTLYRDLERLAGEVERQGEDIKARWRPVLERKKFIPAAENLAHYLALRRQDLRGLQAALTPLGFSSLGRCESHVMPSLHAVLHTMNMLSGAASRNDEPPGIKAFARGDQRLRREADAVLGPAPAHRIVRIMATLPEKAAGNPDWFRGLIRRGVDIARINCAHGDETLWEALIADVRMAARKEGAACRIFMDLAGPKLRTGKVLYPKGDGRLTAGTRLLLRRGPPTRHPRHPWQAEVTLPEALDHIVPGDGVWIDDGNVGGHVVRVLEDGVEVEIKLAPPEGQKLKPDKGINLPNTRLDIPALTEKDKRDLPFVARHADIIGFSFAQSAKDIRDLQEAVAGSGSGRRGPIPLVAKIETQRGVKHLPEIILQGAGRGPFGVMIARGDLAVEIGFARTAEIQEEMLWICEAASVPVIWATQVLESLTKHGRFSRAEMTDAAMSQRAECVMLNKGAYLPEAVEALDDVLVRMQGHQKKKNPQLRSLRSW